MSERYEWNNEKKRKKWRKHRRIIKPVKKVNKSSKINNVVSQSKSTMLDLFGTKKKDSNNNKQQWVIDRTNQNTKQH